MTVQPFDECMYHGERCHVEQVWDSENLSWAMLRPASNLALHTHDGVYIVDQDECHPIPTQGAVK